MEQGKNIDFIPTKVRCEPVIEVSSMQVIAYNLVRYSGFLWGGIVLMTIIVAMSWYFIDVRPERENYGQMMSTVANCYRHYEFQDAIDLLQSGLQKSYSEEREKEMTQMLEKIIATQSSQVMALRNEVDDILTTYFKESSPDELEWKSVKYLTSRDVQQILDKVRPIIDKIFLMNRDQEEYDMRMKKINVLADRFQL